jgi:hypothetical protein
MSDQPWRDRLARARSGAENVGPPAVALPDPSEPPKAPAAPADVLASAAPALAMLLAEREELEARMAALTDPGGSQDPRYPVAPMAERRAEYRRWETAREAFRATRAAPAMPEPRRAEAVTRSEQPRPADRDDAARLPPLRAKTDRVAEPRDRIRREAPLRDVTAALRDVTATNPLARFATELDDAKARVSELFSGDVPFHDRLVATWRERGRALVPQLPGRAAADPYLRDMGRKLGVETGTIAEIGARSEGLRETALAIRELREADEARDETRRERALGRLRQRRAEAA